MIKIEGISKYFGNHAALKDISLSIEEGEIVGFLGPNGAGKTTLMRVLTGYLSATNGRVSISDIDVAKSPLKAKAHIGYLPETPPLYEDMTVIDYLKFAARLKNIPWGNIRKSIERALSDCHLQKVTRKTISTLSKGYRQRVGIAQAIISDPEVLILDEPTTGLDPLQILQVRHLIKSLEFRRIVILSTHILPEIEQIAKRVVIMNKGSVVADKRLDDLLWSPGPQKVVTLEETFLQLTAEEEIA